MNLYTEAKKNTKIKKKERQQQNCDHILIFDLIDRTLNTIIIGVYIFRFPLPFIALDSTSGTFEYNYSNRNHIKFMIL